LVSETRAGRIANRIREILSELLIFEVTDPRLQGIYITDVRVDRELAFASVFVSAIEGSERKDDVLGGLKHATGFLRSSLAQKIELRSFPKLRFNWDSTPENAEKIEKIIHTLHKEEEQKKSANSG
jgi:ribosome-binding factor A